MSHYHHFCLAFSDLSGEVYTSSGSIVLSLTNGTGCDRMVLTLSLVQTLVLSKGLRNIMKELRMEDVAYGNIAGGLTLDFPQEIQTAVCEVSDDHAADEQVVFLDEMRPVA